MPHTAFYKVALVAGLVIGLSALINPVIAAGTVWVDAWTDVPVSGQTTLRQAISAASNGDTIEFATSMFSDLSPKTIKLAATLIVQKNLTIIVPREAFGATGPKPWIQLQMNPVGSGRIMQIKSPATVVIAGVAFQGGADKGGGAVLVDAGATATFVECDFAQNSATGEYHGGAILNLGNLTLDQCRVTANRADNGGGIASFGKCQVIRSQIDGNTAGEYGGGVYSSAANLLIENSTISGNRGETGGGVAFFAGGKTVSASITSDTVVDNQSHELAGGLFVEGSGAVANVGGSIFARNVLQNDKEGSTLHDFATRRSGKINSRDYNIVVKPGTTLSPYGPHDQVGIDPQLGPLSYNGGRTQTYAFGATSPALNRGDPNFSEASTLTRPPTDQREFPRIWPAPNGRVDVGAYEFSATLSLPASIVIEATGASTPVTLTATLALPQGGAVTVTWSVGGVTGIPTTITVPGDGQPQALTYVGSFPLGSTPVTVGVKTGQLTLTSSTTVKVVDTTPPVLTLPADQTLEATSRDGAVANFTASATDMVSGPVPVTFRPTSGSAFAVRTTLVTATAQDASGNIASGFFAVTVRDTIAPVIAPLADIVAEATGPTGALVAFAGNASDTVSGSVPVTFSPVSGSTFALGPTVVIASAIDGAGNSATRRFTVTVRDTTPPVLTLPANLTALAKSAGGATVTFTPTATDAVSAPVVMTSPLSGSVFALGTTTVNVTAKDAAGNTATGSFTVTVTDPFGVSLNNVAWPLAIDLDPKLVLSGGKLTHTVRQMIARPGESRWYKFPGKPGSRIDVSLTNQPANFDVVVYSDIKRVYDQLLGLTGPSASDADKKLALLGVEFAPEAYSPEAYSPEAYSPEAYSPEAYSPEAYSPEAYSPEAYSPVVYSPEAYSPEAYSPEAYSPEAYSPEAYSPEAYSPEAYASAQQRGMIAFSDSPGNASEGIRLHTYSQSGEFYVRVRGQNAVYSPDEPFTLTVAILQNLGSGVTDLNTTPATGAPAFSGSPTSLIVWDSARIVGTANENTALAASLASFATAANGVVVDVAGDAQIVKLNAQADSNPDLPLAKNLVAETIRNLIQLYRKAAPSIADVTLVGNDAGIPFFRSDDKALLASEANYFPPVKDGTQSQSSLRYAQVLSQDRYGSSSQLVLSTGPYDLPDIPVGRVVENAAEVKAYLDTYALLFNGAATNGVVPTPKSAFVAGYDFLADSAEAIKSDFTAGLGAGGTVDSLISPIGLAPALGWTANQFRTAFLGSRHDLSYLAGHFSTGRALAADFTTRIRAAEVADSTLNLAYSLVMSSGCHSGYSTVDNDAISLVTEQPDWAQAFARKKAILIGGSGYQYGDTDFIEYTERLLLNLAQALRTGSGPVSIGQALVQAKRRYLADTAIMRGIHEKTLLELTLYGLPMVKFNLPGARLSQPTPAGDVAGVTPVNTGPGLPLSLKTGELSFSPVLSRVDQALTVVGSINTVTASYFVGSDGLVTTPGEPIRPLESFNVSRPGDGFVRGIGFRGGLYHDLAGFLPFTGAPATETRGVHGLFSTEVFYPIRPWNLNQTGELYGTSGISRLNVFPTQFISDGPVSPTGTLRGFDQMQFTIFYCPATTPAALSNPPAINAVASTVDASAVTFSVDVAATVSVGVQEVWVTYTGLPGSPFYGRWQSLTLRAPAGATGLGTWTGSLPLLGANAGQIRYMVQAVNGLGGVAQSTNFGRYFKPGNSTLDGIGGVVGATTKLSLVGLVPSAGEYRSSLPLQAKLTDGSDQPLVGKLIQFQLGPVSESALTDASGIAAATLVLGTRPDAYTLEANFAGEVAYKNGTDSRPFTVTKLPTQLTFDSTAFVAGTAQIVVSLHANDGTPLKERTVLFVLDNGSTKTALAEITDGAGRVRLAIAGIMPGAYQVVANFGQPVTLPDGSVVALSDPLYAGSTASTSATFGTALSFGGERAWVDYTDLTAPGAAAGNLGVSKVEILGTISSSDPGFGPSSILASNSATGLTAHFTAQLSGKTIAAGSLPLQSTAAGTSIYWLGSADLNDVKVQLRIVWAISGGSGNFHVWIYPAAGRGPLYNTDPALLHFELILGTGTGEHAAGGVTEIGGPDKPWTQQTGGSRVR